MHVCCRAREPGVRLRVTRPGMWTQRQGETCGTASVSRDASCGNELAVPRDGASGPIVNCIEVAARENARTVVERTATAAARYRWGIQKGKWLIGMQTFRPYRRKLELMKTTLLLSVACGSLLLTGPVFGADTKGDAAKGKDLFEQCGVCHNTDSPDKKVGPSLQGLYKKAKLKNGKAVNDANVKAVINAGGNGMPAYADMLSEQERADVIAYLKTI